MDDFKEHWFRPRSPVMRIRVPHGVLIRNDRPARGLEMYQGMVWFLAGVGVSTYWGRFLVTLLEKFPHREGGGK